MLWRVTAVPQDAFTLKYIADELATVLVGGKISKIAQPLKDLVTLIIYTENRSVKLEICLSAKSCRINLAEGEVISPKVAPGFCMLLRKHLQNARITSIKQIEGERVIYIDLDCTSEFELTKMRLYCEIMGKYSNCVLVQDGVIVGALKTTAIGESTKRVLFTGVKYTLPEAQDKIAPDDLKGINEALCAGGDIAKIISSKVRGVSYSTALDIVETYGENVTAKKIVSYLSGEVYAPCVTYRDGVETDFKVRSASTSAKRFESVLKAQTAYYAAECSRQSFDDEKRKLLSMLSSVVKKVEKRLATIEQKLFDCRDMENVRLKGELITANIYAVKRGDDSFEAVNYYDENCGKIKIELDKSLSPADNAQRYFKRYAKLKRTAATVNEQRGETVTRLDYLKSIISHVNAAENLCDFEEIKEELKADGIIKEQEKKKKIDAALPFRTYEKDGFTIYAGRNNVQNDRLLKSISASDLWLHTQGYHSSHVAVITGGKTLPDGVLLAAAEICAYYSDGRGGSKIPVDYTQRKFVKKPPKSNAGFVIYTDYKTVLVNPDGHAELRKD
ncbi:MAG: NFACT family protein [Clostridia bacterium]|nr:NFACT family protein [Clostridia bacterium]